MTATLQQTSLEIDAQRSKPAMATITCATREGRLYALKELARRAGVRADFFQSWRIEVGKEKTTIFVQPGTQKCIRFANLTPQGWTELRSGNWHTARAGWMYAPPRSLAQSVPDFVLPFAPPQGKKGAPLFYASDTDCIECSADLPLLILLTLSRFEEYFADAKDQHGRFAASMSVALREGFLNRPIVDEYGLALEQVLTYLIPGWLSSKRKLHVKLSHDIDTVGIPLRLRNALGHTLRRHQPLATMRDLFGRVVGLRPTHLEMVQKIAKQSQEHALDSAVYWKASSPGPLDSGYDPTHPQIRSVIKWLQHQGIENGIHPGYASFLWLQRLAEEVQILRAVIGDQRLGGRQHYLRWSPETWIHWEACGLAYDSSVGYADAVGFRAGTCFPYRPWLLRLNRQADLIEIPLIVMDCVLPYNLGLAPEEALQLILEYADRCRIVGGVFTLLWHNDSLLDPIYGNIYEKVLDELAGSETFTWTSPKDLY